MLASRLGVLWCSSTIKEVEGVVAVCSAAWSWFLVWVRSLFSAAMRQAQAPGWRGTDHRGVARARKGMRRAELSQDSGIDSIGLGAGLHGLRKRFGGLGVDDHDLARLIQERGAKSR